MKKLVLLSFLISGLQIFGQTILESYPGSTPSIYQTSDYINFNNKMYYFGRTSGYQWSLYSTDGTPTGNQVVKNLGLQIGNIISSTYLDQKYNDYKIEYNGKLYFSIYTNSGETLWQSDGTTAGTVQFLNYNYSKARYFKIFNDKLYFTADNGTNGREVWSTDGTVAGTAMLKDIYPGANPSIDVQFDPHFTVFNNKLFFVANNGTTGFELWSTDGTTSGTNQFIDLKQSETEPGIYNQGAFKYVSNYSTMGFKVFNNKMYFAASSEFTNQYGGYFYLFSTDGTVAGTNYIAPSVDYAICNCTPGSINLIGASSLTVTPNEMLVNGNSIFPIPSIPIGIKILKFNQSNQISFLSSGSIIGDSGSGPYTEQGSMVLFNGEYYFIGQGSTSAELYKINPTTGIKTQVSNPAALSYIYFNDNNGYSRLLLAQVWNNKLYFVKATGSNGAIFATDGTLAGTTEVSKGVVNQQATSSILTALKSSPTHFGAFANGLYFGGSYTAGVPASLQRFYDPSLLSTQENTLNKFSIYPNPTTSQINLSFENNLENASIKIISLLGQTVIEKQNLSGNNLNVEVSNLTAGMYVIEVNDGISKFNSKFIKQ
jgi:ELWxxDGT repeat protein